MRTFWPSPSMRNIILGHKFDPSITLSKLAVVPSYVLTKHLMLESLVYFYFFYFFLLIVRKNHNGRQVRVMKLRFIPFIFLWMRTG